MGNDPFYGRTAEVPDTSPPTPPGKPTGQSNAPGAITLTWPASSDDLATTLSYSIYRDGAAASIGTVSSSSTTTVSFTDTGLAGGSTHTYVVTASDGQNTSQPSPTSDADHGPARECCDLPRRLRCRLRELDGRVRAHARPGSGPAGALGSGADERLEGVGVRGPPQHLSRRHASRQQVNLTSTVDGGSLLRFRTTGDGAIVRVSISSGRILQLRNDVSGTLVSTGVVLPTGTWTSLELCGTVGTSGSWTLYENGVQIFGPWAANTGSATIGRVTIGTPDARTMTVNFDDVVVDQQAG